MLHSLARSFLPLALATWSGLFATAAIAQDPPGVVRRGLPTRIPLGDPNTPANWMIPLGGGGQMTPDGRVVLRGWAFHGIWPAQDGWPAPVGDLFHGWAVQVVRPELITRDANYQPVFSAQVFSPVEPGYLLEPGLDPNNASSTYGDSFIKDATFLPASRSGAAFPGATTSGIPQKAHTTWFPDPYLDLSPNGELPPTNPYACDANGEPTNGLPAPEQAPFVAYEMLVLTFCPEYTLQTWQYVQTESRVRQVPVKVVVQAPYTANATVAKAWVTGRAEDAQWYDQSAGQHRNLYLEEISVTQNGHFLVGHGPLPSAYSGSPPRNRFRSNFAGDMVIWATWNPEPGNPQTWHEPVVLSELHKFANTTLKTVNGVPIPLRDVVRLASKPMRYQNGDLIGDKVANPTFTDLATDWDASFGAYPWVHWDGDGVLYPIGGSRSTIAYCGVQTNFTFASLDAANNSHLVLLQAEEQDKNTEEHVMSGLMAMSGMWDVYRRTSRTNGRAVLEANPAHPEEPTFAFIHGESLPQRLTTMSFEDFSDGEYMAFLRMTPLVKRIDRSPTQPMRNQWTWLQLDQTTDTSGNYHVAALQPDAFAMSADVPTTCAAFTVATSDARPFGPSGSTLPFRRPVFDTGSPMSTLGQVKGRVGEAIRLGRLGYVWITNSSNTPPPSQPGVGSLHSDAITIEAFVKPSAEFLALSRTQPMRLFHHQGRITVSITPSNGLLIEVPNVTTPPAIVTHTTAPVMTQAAWYHIAVTFGAQTVRCYRDGVLVAQAVMAGGGLPVSPTNVFEIGPNGTVSGSDAVMLHVDEFRLSRIVRSAEEIAKHAYVEVDKTWVTNPAQLPSLAGTPVKIEDCRVDPARPWTANKRTWGQFLFQSTMLSLTQNYSCASCHQLGKSFTDGLSLAVGHAGGILPFGTPTVLNSLTGTRMFWDMRTPNLFEQSVQPILTPIELGFTHVNTVISRIQANPPAMTLHAAAFGAGAPVTRATLQLGLESYMQSLIVPNTAVENYENGTATALSAAEKNGRALFHGKARCIACHNGPSYTDAIAHNTGVSIAGQNGFSVVSGRARDFGAFKTPTLRRTSDLAANGTKPYFHDGLGGVATSLTQVVDFYDLGGGQAGVTAIAPGRTSIGTTHIEMMRLGLTPAEKADLIAFLRRLGE